MITGRDPTPEERRRYARSYRFHAISGTVFAVAFSAIGLIALARGRHELYGYVQCVLGVGSIVSARFNWVRWRKYAD